MAAGRPFYFVHDATALEEALAQLRLALVVGALVLDRSSRCSSARRHRARRPGARSRPPAGPPSGSRAATCRRACRSPRTTSSGRGRSGSTGWPRRSPTRSAGSRPPSPRTGGSWPTSRTSCGPRWPRSSPRRRSCASTSARCRPRAGAPASCWSPTSAGCATLVDDLMEVSRFDARAERIALEPVDLGRLVRTVAAARLPEATLELPADAARHRHRPAPARADPRQPARQRPRARAGRRRSRSPSTPIRMAIVIAVADRGPGVPPDQLDRIFERFYKADPSRHGGSSGLGLAIAAEHAALLGGYLTAANRPGGGLRIELRLPVTGPLPPATRRRSSPARCWGSDRSATRSSTHEAHAAPSSSPAPSSPRRARRGLQPDRPAASGPSRPSPRPRPRRADEPGPDARPERRRSRPSTEPSSEPTDDARRQRHARPRPRRRRPPARP